MSADIDIDTPTSFDASKFFKWTKASLVKDGILRSHPCGVYPQNISVDCMTSLAAIPYKDAEIVGYSKLDFLHLHIYDYFQSRSELEELIALEPDWGLLLVPAEQKKLFQLSNHGDVLSFIKPKCIEELADVLALIRPGKKQLMKLYMRNRESTRKILYAKDENGYSFKKAHAISYALVIVLRLHLISTGII